MCAPIASSLALLGLSLLPLADAEQKSGAPASLLPNVSLGLTVEETSGEGDEGHGGLMVREVDESGPAAKAGLKKGDLIVRVSNRPIEDYDELVSAIAGSRPGEQVTFTVIRDNEPKRVKVTLGDGAKDGAKKPAPDGCQKCAYLGVMAIPSHAILPETAAKMGLTDTKGLVILDVVPGSPAAQAGLRHGDVIRTIDGKNVREPRELRHQVHNAGAGKEVKLTVQRGDQTREIQAKVGEEPCCDIHLYTPKEGTGVGADQSRTIERLERRIERLESRIRELEGPQSRPPAKK